MNNLVHADIFFFITTIALVLLTIGALIISYYIFRIVRTFKHITDKIREESDHVTEDFALLREKIKTEGTGLLTALMGNLFRWFGLRSFRSATSRRKAGSKKQGKKEKVPDDESDLENDGQDE